MGSPSKLFAATLCCFAFIVVHVYGELVMLHHSRNLDPHTRNYTCISDDDGSALVWSYFGTLAQKGGTSDFKPRRPATGNIRDCGIRGQSTCLAEWDETRNWHVLNSLAKPTGPVFDQRWEDFLVSHIPYDENWQYQKMGVARRSSGTLWFSGTHLSGGRFGVLLCEREEPHLSPCVGILVTSAHEIHVQSCRRGAATPDGYLQNSECNVHRRIRDVTFRFLELTEWHLFRIEWDTKQRTIKMFQGNNIESLVEGPMPPWDQVSAVAATVVQGPNIHLRFHSFDYYFTRTRNAVISTKRMGHSGKTFCAELLLGLCRTCKLNVALVDGDGNDIETWLFSGDEEDPYNGLLAWRLVRLISHFDSDIPRRLTLKMKTIGYERMGEWMIDNFRICQSGKLRESKLIMGPQLHNLARCYKLSYAGISTAGYQWLSGSRANETQARLSEVQDYIRNRDQPLVGRGGYICGLSGCICDRGYTSSYCYDECENGSYSFGCTNECGSCLNSEPCNKSTGFCEGGCQGNMIKPFCKTALNAMTLENIRGTTATLLQTVELADKDEEINKINFQIREAGGKSWTNYPSAKLKGSEISSSYKAHITDLKPGKDYVVRAAVFARTELAPAVTFGQEYNLSIRSVLLEIRNLRVTSITDTAVRFQWDPPAQEEGVIGSYSVSLQLIELRGCRDLDEVTPREEDVVKIVDETTVFFEGLHPYAKYVVSVAAQTLQPDPQATLSFETNFTVIPNSIVSDLRVTEDRSRVMWGKPADCTTITGPTKVVRLFVTRVSDSALIRKDQTAYPYYNLSNLHLEPLTWYKVRVHVVRGYNEPENPDVYQELTWRKIFYDVEGPAVIDVTDSTARVIQNVQNAAHAGETFVTFILTEVWSNKSFASLPTHSAGVEHQLDVKNLKPNALYKVYSIIIILESDRAVTLDSSPRLFKTKCFDKPRFEVSPGDHDLTIRMSSRPGDCKHLVDEIYSTNVYNTAKSSLESTTSFASSSVLIQDLNPDTEYEVKIWSQLQKEPRMVFTTKVRTSASNEAVLQTR